MTSYKLEPHKLTLHPGNYYRPGQFLVVFE